MVNVIAQRRLCCACGDQVERESTHRLCVRRTQYSNIRYIIYTQYTVVRAMARHRWRHSQYVGLTRVQLEHSRRRADREHQRQAREQAERRSEEAVRMAQEHYFPWRPEW